MLLHVCFAYNVAVTLRLNLCDDSSCMRSRTSCSDQRVQALGAALPKRIRERHDRKAAYDVSKKKVSEWTPLVRANREAATLHLKRDAAVPRVATAAGLASRHEAVSAFEHEVAAMLKQAGHTSTKAIAEVRTRCGALLRVTELAGLRACEGAMSWTRPVM